MVNSTDSAINITLTFPISGPLETSNDLLSHVMGNVDSMSTGQLKNLELAMQSVANEISRIISIREVIAERERLEAEKARWIENKVYPRWRQKEIWKEKNSPKNKANEAIMRLTGGALNVNDFIMMTKVFCKEHMKLKAECGCGQGEI